MASVTITTLTKILKDTYLGPIRDQITDGVVLYQAFAPNREDVSAFSGTTQQAIIPVHKGRNPSVTFQTEDATLPTAGKQAYERLTYTLKSQYGRFSITGQALKATRNNAAAFARGLEREIDGLIRDFRNELNRVLNGDGTGVLTQINGAATSATQTVDSTRFLFDGMEVLIATDQSTIDTVNSDTSITLTASITTADNDNVKRRIGSATPSEANGIANIVDSTGSIGGVSATGNTWWQSVELDGGGTDRDLTLDLMQELTRKVEERKNAPPDFYHGKHALRDMYLRQLVADKRFVNTMDLDGGFKAVTYNDIPFMTDKDGTDKTLYAISKKHFQRFEAGDMDWMDADGAVLSRLADKDAYEATLAYHWELGTDNRRYQAKLTELNES